MRAVLCVLALVCIRSRVVAATDTENMVAALLEHAGCGPVDIVESTKCVLDTFASVTGSDTCANFGMYMPCWPKCFCEHGFEHMLAAYKPQCANLPSCGGSGKRRHDARSKLAQRQRALAKSYR
jgi:hypothetical protein